MRKSHALLFLATVLLSGCIIFYKKSDAVTFHQLSSPVGQPTRPEPLVYVPRSVIPSALRRPNVVMLDEAGWVRVEDAHRWISPLDRSVSEVVGHHFTKLTGLPAVNQAPASRHLVLLIDVAHMSVTSGRQAILEIRFRLEKEDGAMVSERSLRQAATMTDTTPEQYVRAQSVNLAAASAAFIQSLPPELRSAR